MTKKMTRREALKTLGVAIGTVTASVSSVSGLTSCKEEKKRLIFYFTATGNSLFVARELGGKNIISIPQALKKGELVYEADEIGIVYPVYGHMPPNLVQRKRMNAKFLFFSGIRLFNKIISAVFRRIC